MVKCKNCSEDVVRVYGEDSKTWQWHHQWWANRNPVYASEPGRFVTPIDVASYMPHLVTNVICACGCYAPEPETTGDVRDVARNYDPVIQGVHIKPESGSTGGVWNAP